MSPKSQDTMYMILSSKTQLLTGQCVTCELPVATGQAYLELNKLHMFGIYLALYTLEFRMVGFNLFCQTISPSVYLVL